MEKPVPSAGFFLLRRPDEAALAPGKKCQQRQFMPKSARY
jgi:hypothetical protein